jgi:hypothetical protein
LPAEFRLAVECCAFPQGRHEAASDLAKAVDWNRFLTLSRRHRIQGLAWRTIRTLGLDPPSEIAQQIAADAIGIAKDGLLAASVSGQLLREFDAANIALLFVKGLTLSKLAYDDPFLKMSHDIDILVPLDAVERAGRLLAGLKYVAAFPRTQSLTAWHATHKESVWVRSGFPTVELHTRLADNRRLIPGIGHSSLTAQVELAPDLALPTLRDDALLAYLCVHGASSAWFRLKWVADLAALLAQYDPARLEAAVARSHALGAGRTVAAAVLLVDCLFDIAISDAVRKRISNPTNRWLVRLWLKELVDETEPTDQFLGTASLHLSQFFLAPGPAYKASEFVRQLRSLVARPDRR